MVPVRKLRPAWAASMFALLASLASAQGAAPQSSPGGQAQAPPAPAARVVSRNIQPDGTIELTYSDGSKRRVALDSPAASGGGSGASEAASPVAPPEWLKDPATNQAFLDAMGEYYRYRASGLRHRSRVFEWQLLSSKFIFVTVLMLVGAGMVFAAIQFRAGLRRPKGEAAAGTTAAPEVATQIDLSATSVKVSSPVLGVIILVISLAFFYLYLVYVYPISEIL